MSAAPPDALAADSERVGPAPAVVAGVVTAVVGFTSSFAVVLTGLAAVGATRDQAASGLFVLCVAMGLGSIAFSLRYRMPITMAWSTPGAALLAAAARPAGGFGVAVAAFLLTGILLALCGLVRPLGRAVAKVPTALANAMLAGVLLHLCVQPFQAAVAQPAAILPVLATWLLLLRFARRWAVPGALVAATIVLLISGLHLPAGDRLAPVVTLVAPHWDMPAVLALAIPLFLVTMTSQNIPGMAVLGSFGYRPPLAPALVYSGLATVAGAPAGAHAVNLAAISAALAAGPHAHPDPRRRWIAGVITGVGQIALGPLSALLATIAAAAPAGLLPTIAGLALIGTFASAGGAALAEGTHREAAAMTFLVAAAGIGVAGIGAAFWGLLAGLVVLAVTTAFSKRAATPS